MPLPISPQLKFKNESSMLLCKDIKFDDAAFENFFRNNFSSICSYYQIKFGFDMDETKEVVHTGFIRLWENRQNLSADVPIKAYLYKVILNICVDILRHQKVKQKHEKYVLRNNIENCLKNNFHDSDIKYLAADIDKAVSELPEQMKKIFELSRYNGLKYAEISSYLNISVKTVETQMSRALVKLRQKLFRYLPLYFLFVFFFYGVLVLSIQK